ncbi:MAG: iron-sulfur cluster carrier protein ApbC [Dokdonella sp.]|uniref:iron-sulfur cluster carrier protein ApbC n=1 Tax=Dokdonella sp. TaxID=2291710 RepID=UPI002C586601|nr:iron-sulfur cluster carrier protein ApbC [Dokdonella sp.]HOX71226.1 iron-sulfur cluster carrier protein ApbC [Dokdonella sp.]HPG94274.1 iron-sulfur cluster carrier protein ApbC [Dokdonella sp.]HPN78927.1 iron-sulfur cluster carrier protein ApbC [Dokdonella sp.]
MSETVEERVRKLISGIIDPHSGQDLVSAGALRGVGVSQGRVSIDIQLGYPALSWQSTLSSQVKAALEADAMIESAAVSVSCRVGAHRVQEGLTPMPNIRNVIAVASGKGGVGKSTVAANLALALRAEGASVGVLDADIYGPSQPRMLGLSGKPDTKDGNRIEPKLNHGIQVMSIGFLIEEDTPMIWRGPMVTQALQQLLSDTNWVDLDYLVIDLPPGTGDIQLTLCQRVPVSGAVIVTTPQDIALLDARKALKMFEKVNVPVLGIIENMSTHRCTHCGHEEHLFGEGGGQRMAEQYGVPLLGELPLDIRIREQADQGTPVVAALPDSEIASRYRTIARNSAARLSLQARNKSIQFPKIVIQNT